METNNHKKWGVIRKAKRVGKINNIFMKTNFFDSNSYFIDEKVNFFKLENCYQIYNEKGENIGTIAQKLSLGNKILRLLLNKTMLPFHLEIKNSDNDVEASISRGWSFFMSKITVKNAQGNTIGTIKQKFTLFKPTFKIFDSSDVLIAEISGDWSAWNFTIADASGNLIEDNAEQLDIEWNIKGKVTKVTDNSTPQKIISFEYDANGNRVKKKVSIANGPCNDNVTTYYVYADKGTLLATYSRQECTPNTVYLDEHTIYGSKRLGVRNYPGVGQSNRVSLDNVEVPNNQILYKREIFAKHYELSDHLGNVRAVISDAKWSYNGIMTPHIVSYTNYYPFGMAQPGRNWSSSGYRFGYQGQEKVDEISGSGNHNTAEFWEMDTRLGKRWERDPVVKHHESPYAILGNNPIWFIDFNGADTSQVHQEIINASLKFTSIDVSQVEWKTSDIIIWKCGSACDGGNEYLFNRKLEFISHMKNVIKDASAKYNIPEFWLAGIIFSEFGGDPMWIDDVAYGVRSFDWSGPEWVDRNLTTTKDPNLTSFGNVSVQIRTAAKELGYAVESMTSTEMNLLINSLKNPVQSIYIAAKHLSTLKKVDFAGKSINQITADDVKIITTRYNRGSELSADEIKKNLSYGNHIYEYSREINNALNPNAKK